MNTISKSKWLLFLSTLMFFLVHSLRTSWDFVVYSLNAKYWMGIGQYFELSRPPLMSFIMFILGAHKISEYLFIIVVASLFYYTCKRFSKVAKLNETLFYLFMLNPYVLYYGLQDGSELLSLILLMLGIILILENKKSGYMFGLGFLSRYTNLTYSILVIFKKHKNKYEHIKDIIINALLFFIPVIPWFFYNYYKTGNHFQSIADSFANVIKFRGYLTPDQNWHYLFLVVNILLPFLVYGLYKKIKSKKYDRTDIIILSFALITLYNYSTTPITVPRYLFSLTLPIAYYSVLYLSKIKIKMNTIITYFILTLIFILTLSFNLGSDITRGEAVVKTIEELNITDCSIKSDYWIYVPYISDYDVLVPGQYRFIDYYIKEGYVLIYEDDNVNHPLRENIHGLSVIRNKTFCKKAVDENYFRAYLDEYQEVVRLKSNETYDIDACSILFEDKDLLKKACNIVNFRYS